MNIKTAQGLDAFISNAVARGAQAFDQVPGSSMFGSPLLGKENPVMTGFGKGFGQHAGKTQAIGQFGSEKWQSALKHLPAVAGLVGGAALVKNMYDRWQANQLRREILKDPKLTAKYQPEDIQLALKSVNRYAPSLSADKNTVTNTIKRVLEYDGVNVEDVKQLMELEKLYQESVGANTRLFRPISDMAKLVI